MQTPGLGFGIAPGVCANSKVIPAGGYIHFPLRSYGPPSRLEKWKKLSALMASVDQIDLDIASRIFSSLILLILSVEDLRLLRCTI
jgi:hypothetical protein